MMNQMLVFVGFACNFSREGPGKEQDPWPRGALAETGAAGKSI